MVNILTWLIMCPVLPPAYRRLFHPGDHTPAGFDPLRWKRELKDVFAGKTVVLNLSAFVAGRIGASWTQFRAQVEINDAMSRQFILQRFAVELWCETAVWAGPNVAEGGDAVL